ncbi:DUF4097 family beta strand repeat-containing protein [Actinomadura sp. 6K520]|uniref:DUF4097 family beta strand repeat-containing protein n=1 Tax=Actinomadura sp. 6K520 TaxID=2530364 RepID=UPI00104455A0|nr:DUF4097 family beta strand repeat-containing protein [Actinomadura sp. 6K520]TDE30171.1 hypothetical protein E1289_19010 [Actinomadura sp. 6K520]
MKTLTATAMLAVAAAALTGCGNVSFGTGEETRSYTAPTGVRALKITGNGGRVEVTATDTTVIKVTERLRWSNEKNKPDTRHTTEGDAFKLSAACSKVTMGTTTCGVVFRVQVPRDAPVEIDSRDGSITASGLGGTVRLHSADGSIEADDLRATSAKITSDDGSVRVSGSVGDAELRTSNGSITAAGLTGDRVTAHSSNGRIQLSGRAGTVDLETANGSVHATGLTAERVNARTSDGSVRLGFASPPMNVQAKSNNGSIRLGLPDGQGYAISMATDNGGERIDPAVRQDSSSPRHVTLDTDNGSITVTASP